MKKKRTWKQRKPAWHKATDTIEAYKVYPHDKLTARPVQTCLSCADPHCTDVDHTVDRDSFMLDILCSVVETSHCVLPLLEEAKHFKLNLV